ncbi:MAG: uncharacterized protein KVP18_000238 [Porospora cf. gigantea A]|uniref:uncharacterized protein n=1 Tax=Porospora cf. gigantea A TaxID=2853593 RepID=UPI003559D5C1|nr:MAG: hypothetical protein KVP18_000238 [Porospora cf. gigantea A]
MVSLVTRPAPAFTAEAVMPNGSFKQVSLSDCKGKHVVLFFWPFDFTFVCPSEIIAFDKALEKFRQRGVEVLGVSIDSTFVHFAWKSTPVEKGGIGNVQFPLIADVDKSIAKSYGVLLEGGIALRGTFIIDKEGIVRSTIINDLPLGRSVKEVLRIVDAQQFTEEHGEVCPANWRKGKAAMKPTAVGVAAYLEEHYGKEEKSR